MTPDRPTPSHDDDDRHDDHPQRRVEREAPGSWVADPEGDAPEPNEPA